MLRGKMSTRVFRLVIYPAIAIAAVQIGAIAQANATPAYFTDANTAPSTLGNPPFTLGSEFTTSGSTDVTGLGIYDSGQNGLADSYQIGIWDSGGNLVASGTVASGTADPLIDQWRYVSITPVLLAAG